MTLCQCCGAGTRYDSGYKLDVQHRWYKKYQETVPVNRIRIIWPDPEFWMPDPDPRLQNWHLINLFSVEKCCE
jgi:hypothetical protein